MANTEEKTGAEILALAHNGNLSNGRMFRVFGPSHARSYQEVTVSRDPTGFQQGAWIIAGGGGSRWSRYPFRGNQGALGTRPKARPEGMQLGVSPRGSVRGGRWRATYGPTPSADPRLFVFSAA